MNKTIVLLAIAGLSLANPAADNELLKFSDLLNKARGGIKKAANFVASNPESITRVAQFIANKADQEEDDEELGKLGDIIRWGYNNRHLLKEAVKLIKSDDEEILEDSADDEFGFRDTIKKGIKKAAQFVASNPETITRVAQFIANKAVEEEDDEELGKLGDIIRWGYNNRHILKDAVKLIRSDDEEALDDELGFRDTIKKGFNKVVNYVKSNPETVARVGQFLMEKFTSKADEESDDELGFRDDVREAAINIKNKAKEAAATIKDGVKQAVTDTKTQIKKGANWIHNKFHRHDKVVVIETPVKADEVESNSEDELIGAIRHRRADDELIGAIRHRRADDELTFNGEDVFIGF